MDVIDRVDGLGARAAGLRQQMVDARLAARTWTRDHGEDHPVIADWQWPAAEVPSGTSDRDDQAR